MGVRDLTLADIQRAIEWLDCYRPNHTQEKLTRYLHWRIIDESHKGDRPKRHQ